MQAVFRERYDVCVKTNKHKQATGRSVEPSAQPSKPAPARAAAGAALRDRGEAPWTADLVAASLDGGSPSPAATVPFRSVGFTISTTGYAVARLFRQILAPLELEPREFALLRAVGASEGQSQQAIGERLQIPASRMVAFVDALEARGLLERRQNKLDRRARALHLTKNGANLLARAFALAAAHERDLCVGLSDAEREQLLDLLQRVGDRLGLPPGVHSALADE
jgi:DNA-binding MarR family transcriptional regulator